MSRMRATRAGFTLVELMIVIAILLLLTLFAVSIFSANAGADRMRSAARVAQSAFLGARDRALHAKERRGVRLVRDETDPTLAVGFLYVQPTPLYRMGTPGFFAVARPDNDGDWTGTDATADDPRYIVVAGTEGQALFDIDSAGMMQYGLTRIRVPADPPGNWYIPLPISANPPYYCVQQAGLTVIQLRSAVEGTNHAMPNVQAIATSDVNANAEFELGQELVPMHQPIPLPSGIVIDLDLCSAQIAAAVAPTTIDILFAPRGAVTGPVSALGPLHFLLRDIQDATQDLNPVDPAVQGEQLVLTVFPMTGNVQTFPVDLTDTLNNSTGAAGADGLADDLFRYAKVGSTAGQ